MTPSEQITNTQLSFFVPNEPLPPCRSCDVFCSHEPANVYRQRLLAPSVLHHGQVFPYTTSCAFWPWGWRSSSAIFSKLPFPEAEPRATGSRGFRLRGGSLRTHCLSRVGV